MSEANEVDGEGMDCWINTIDKPVRIKKDSGIVLRRLKTIHFAHCVRSVAATRRIQYFITSVCTVVMSSEVETSGFCQNLLFVHGRISPLGSASVEMTKNM